MEKKKLLLVSVSVGLFLVIVIGVSILAFSPKSYSAFESVRAQARELSQGESGGVRIVKPGETSLSESAPPVPPLTSAASASTPQIQTSEVPPPAPVTAEGQTPLTSQTAAQPAPQNENVIYINGENAENAVKVERLSGGNTRTYITFPHSSGDVSQVAVPVAVPVAPPVTAQAQATAAVEVRAPPAAVQITSPAPVTSAPPESAKPVAVRTEEPKPAVVKTAQTKPVATKPVVTKPAVEKTAASGVKPQKEARPVQTTPRRSDYWVQTGSFATKSRADEASGFLAIKGIASIVQDTSVNGKVFYRVRVGPYTTQNEANYWLALVKTIDGMENSLVWKAN